MTAIPKVFQSNVEFVYELLDFDHFILDFVVEPLDDYAARAKKHGIHTLATDISNRATMLKNIRAHDSLRPRYETIYNQCVVLLVSHFGSAVHATFREAITRGLEHPTIEIPAATKSMDIRWRDLKSVDGPPAALFADLLITEEDMKFQDMQSIVRAFKDFLGIEMPRGEMMNNIILGQAARHVIVHSGAFVNKKMVKQVSGCQLPKWQQWQRPQKQRPRRMR